MAVRDYFRIDIRGLSVQREFLVRWRGQLTETVPFSVFTIAVNKISWSRQPVITVTKIEALWLFARSAWTRSSSGTGAHDQNGNRVYTRTRVWYTSIVTEKTYSLLEIRIHTCLHAYTHMHTQHVTYTHKYKYGIIYIYR